MPDDTFPIDEVLKPHEGQRLKIYIGGVGGALDGYFEKDLGGGYSIFRQPEMTVPHPMTGQPIEMPESNVTVHRPSIVMFEPSEDTSLSKLSAIVQ